MGRLLQGSTARQLQPFPHQRACKSSAQSYSVMVSGQGKDIAGVTERCIPGAASASRSPTEPTEKLEAHL